MNAHATKIKFTKVNWRDFPQQVYSRKRDFLVFCFSILLLGGVGSLHPLTYYANPHFPISWRMALYSVILVASAIVMLRSMLYKLFITGKMRILCVAAGKSGLIRPTLFYDLYIPWQSIHSVCPQNLPRPGFLKGRDVPVIRITFNEARWNGFWHSYITGWNGLVFPSNEARDTFLQSCHDYLNAHS